MAIYITIVGTGHYANDLILSKYLDQDQIVVKAGVDPNNTLETSAPTFYNIKEWVDEFGSPGKKDVFDLCVHQPILFNVLEPLADAGAKNFILPKPVALDKEDWDRIINLQSKFNLKLVVASQWFYSDFLKFLKTFIQNIEPEKVIFRFSQHYSQKEYTFSTALLPHIIQICCVLEINLKNIKVECEKFFTVESEGIDFYISNLGKVRQLTLLSKGYNIDIDFLGCKEDNLKTMVDKMIPYFLYDKDDGVLTLEKYKEVASYQIEIERLKNEKLCTT